MLKMNLRVLSFMLVLALPAFAQDLRAIQQSHIDANVPNSEDFQAF